MTRRIVLALFTLGRNLTSPLTAGWRQEREAAKALRYALRYGTPGSDIPVAATRTKTFFDPKRV